MMYACKIDIKYEPQKIRYIRKIKLPDRLLNLEDISKHLKEGEKFSFSQEEEGWIKEPINYLIIYNYRYETKEELRKRIMKQEKYNENYEKFHTKWGKINLKDYKNDKKGN